MLSGWEDSWIAESSLAVAVLGERVRESLDAACVVASWSVVANKSLLFLWGYLVLVFYRELWERQVTTYGTMPL